MEDVEMHFKYIIRNYEGNVTQYSIFNINVFPHDSIHLCIAYERTSVVLHPTNRYFKRRREYTHQPTPVPMEHVAVTVTVIPTLL